LEEATGFVFKDINKIKANLMTRDDQSEEDLKGAMHVDVDIGPTKYMTFVYYVTDSDGDTVIYEKNNSDAKLYPVHSKSPKKGTAVCFPSEMWHRATPPKDHKRRIVLNIIVEVE
jgi:hypothetical protein